MLLVPLACPPVQLRHPPGSLVEEARPQHVGEELVVAIPPAAVVERDEEQVPAIQRLQHGLAPVLAGDRVAQRAGQAGEDRRLQQEAPDLLGLTVQDLLDQVVDDVAVVPREARDEAGDIVAPLHRQRRQLEGGDPAFGAPLQRGDVPRGEIQPHHLVEVRGGLVRREAQIGGADLDELAPRPQAGQRQRRIGAGGDHQVDLWGQVLQQERHPVIDVVRVDHVVVVEHQHDVVRHRAELVEQRGEDRLDRRRLGPLQKGQRTCADPRRRRLQRGDQVGPEGGGLRCQPGRARATPQTVHRPERLPATRPAASSCRSRPGRR